MSHVLLVAAAVVAAYPAPRDFRRSCTLDVPVQFVLPIEAGSGAVLGAGSPVPWSFSTRLLPTLVVGGAGKVRLGGVVGLAYTNPDWEPLYGGRLGYRPINAPLGLLGIEVAGEVTGGVPNRVPVAASLTIDIGTVITLHARGIPNLDNKTGFFEAGLGVYISTIVDALRTPPEPTVEDLDEHPPFADVLATHVTPEMDVAVQEFVAVNGEEALHNNCTKVDALRGVVADERRNPSPTLDALKARLDAAGFDDVAQSLDDAIESAIQQFIDLNPGAARPDDAAILTGVVAALGESVRRIGGSVLPDTRE